eukprot:760332-Rhodomonas_salina.1
MAAGGKWNSAQRWRKGVKVEIGAPETAQLGRIERAWHHLRHLQCAGTTAGMGGIGESCRIAGGCDTRPTGGVRLHAGKRFVGGRSWWRERFIETGVTTENP